MSDAVTLVAVLGGLALGGGNVLLLTGIYFRVGELSQAMQDLARRVGLLEDGETA